MLRSGLLGKDILASRSPWLHEQEARALGMQLTYELFDFRERDLADDALGPLLRRLLADGYCGVNVTHPFKTAVIPLLDSVEEGALAVGAVNTVAMQKGRLVGYNTDMPGFRDSFAAELPGASLSAVLQLGAGGAGAAVACALLSLGAQRLVIADVRPERADQLVGRLQARFPQARVQACAVGAVGTSGFAGVVNTTPIGMAAHPGSPFDVNLLRQDLWVADVIYFPLETLLLRRARELGCRVLNGSGMVIRQAALAFQILTGRTPDLGRMARSFGVTPRESSTAAM